MSIYARNVCMFVYIYRKTYIHTYIHTIIITVYIVAVLLTVFYFLMDFISHPYARGGRYGSSYRYENSLASTNPLVYMRPVKTYKSH